MTDPMQPIRVLLEQARTDYAAACDAGDLAASAAAARRMNRLEDALLTGGERILKSQRLSNEMARLLDNGLRLDPDA